ncbi:MAG: ferrochelatase [Candidatus Dadabacteria bacterium]|nr:ferrochelatase [Candidatus Dadabacteria bacterium]
MQNSFDAVMMIGYGAPEKKEDIIPFLKNVTSGRPIPEDRLREVAHHYEIFDGKSPLNEFTYRQAQKLEKLLSVWGYDLPVYVGMRNWHPFIKDSLEKIKENGVKSLVGLIMAIYRSDASWDRYMRDISEGCEELGMELHVEYVPPLFNHPLFLECSAAKVTEQMRAVPKDRLDTTMLVFTAHSIPQRMSDSSPYALQFETSSMLVADRVGHKKWMIAYQSRSGSPNEKWLEPDICEVIEKLADKGFTDIVIQPIGFLCDHIEVLFDIGVEATEAARECGVNIYRAETVNDDDRYIRALGDGVLRLIDSENSAQQVR